MFGDYLILQIIFCLIFGYFCGIFSSGYYIGKLYHVDLKHEGSGNLGTTNVLRVLGFWPGIATLVIDLSKTFIPIILVRYLMFPQYVAFSDMNQLLILYTSLGCVCGHLFPFYLKFRGGKGVACMGACMLLFDWRLAVIGLIIFILVLAISRYMSLASLTISVLFPIYVGIVSGGNIHMTIVTCLFTISTFYNHRQNIRRLIDHNENRFTVKRKAGGK